MGLPQGVAQTLAVEGVSSFFGSLSFASFSDEPQLSEGCLQERFFPGCKGEARPGRRLLVRAAPRLLESGLDQAVLQLGDCPAQPRLITGCSGEHFPGSPMLGCAGITELGSDK